MEKREVKRDRLIPTWVLWLVLAGGVINFLVAFTVAMSIGGDGLNGYATNGHYFLYLNGKYTETSHAIFEYSKWHFISVFVTHPLAIAAGWILTFRGRAWLKSQGFGR